MIPKVMTELHLLLNLKFPLRHAGHFYSIYCTLFALFLSFHFLILIMCTVFFQVLAAEIHYPGHLSVNRVKAELFVVALLPVASRLYWQRQLEGLQEPRLVIIKVSDAIHRYSTLSSRWATTIQRLL